MEEKEREKAGVQGEFSAVAVLKATEELKRSLPELQQRVGEIEALEEAYLKRKADLKGIDDSLVGFRVALAELSSNVRRISESVGNVEEYNRKRLVVLDKLEQVLDGYGVFVKAISDFEKQ